MPLISAVAAAREKALPFQLMQCGCGGVCRKGGAFFWKDPFPGCRCPSSTKFLQLGQGTSRAEKVVFAPQENMGRVIEMNGASVLHF